MKTWSKADLLSLFLVILGIISLIFSTSNLLPIFCFMLASIILLHCVYNSRYELLKYRDFLCHYQAVLTSANDGWIAWNDENEYIGSSKKFRDELGIKFAPNIFVSDILAVLKEEDANELTFQLNKLKKVGTPFNITVSPQKSGAKIKICGSRVIVSGIETTLLWSSDITNTLILISSLEKKLFESEEALSKRNKILDELPIQVWSRNSDLKIIYCNKRYADSIGQSREKVLAHNVPLIPGTLFGQGHSLAENAKKCNRDQSIAQFAVIDGVRRKLVVSEKHVDNGAFVGFAQDITEEDDLSMNLDRIIKANYDVLDNLSTAIAIFGDNMRLIFFNSAYQKLMKLETVWLHAKPTYAEVLDECRNNRQMAEHADFQAFKKTELAMFTSITSPVQELMHLPNGKTLRRLTAPYPLGGLLFVFEDVTDSLALQRKNNTLLAVQKETIDHLHEGIVVYGSNNRVKILNNSVLKIWDVGDKSIDEIKGMHISDMLEYLKEKIDYGENWQEFKENAISSLTDRTPKTGRLMRKDDSVVLFSYIPLPDGAHMLSFIDITDTCTVEKAIMEKNIALKEAHKLRYEFVSGISTELKEPINCLMGFTELLSREYYGTLNQKQKEYCQYILDSSNQLHQLINNLLEMVLIDIGSNNLEMSTFIVKDVINEAISIVEKRAHDKNVTIETLFENPIIKMNGDRKRIKQFLFNVLINAIQASPVDGKIEVRTVVDGEDGVKIIVKDQRIEHENVNAYKIDLKRRHPLNAPVRAHIRRILESKGASMLLVRSLIEQHGGTLSVNSDAEGGSYVICSLPTKYDNRITPDKLLYEYKDEGNKQEETNNQQKEELQEGMKTAVNG